MVYDTEIGRKNSYKCCVLFVRFGLKWDDAGSCLTCTVGSLAPFVIIMQQEWYVTSCYLLIFKFFYCRLLLFNILAFKVVQ